jgi:hypothetical protein
MCRGKEPGRREGKEGGREGRCSDNLLLLSFMSKLWWVGRTSMLVVTAI